MLSDLIISQRFIVVLDKLGEEKSIKELVVHWLCEQGIDESTIKSLNISLENLMNKSAWYKFLQDCYTKQLDGINNQEGSWNVILPNFSDMLIYKNPSFVFRFLYQIKQCNNVRRIFILLSPRHIVHERSNYLVAACKYMADLILYIEPQQKLIICCRKPGGKATCKKYTYKRKKYEFLLELYTKSAKKSSIEIDNKVNEDNLTDDINIDSSDYEDVDDSNISNQIFHDSTFKLDLDEDAILARNTLKLPYEKVAERQKSTSFLLNTDEQNIDEDPDDDLDM